MHLYCAFIYPAASGASACSGFPDRLQMALLAFPVAAAAYISFPKDKGLQGAPKQTNKKRISLKKMIHIASSLAFSYLQNSYIGLLF